MTSEISQSERRFSQSCQVRLNARIIASDARLHQLVVRSRRYGSMPRSMPRTGAHDAHILPHRLLQRRGAAAATSARLAAERLAGAGDLGVQHCLVGIAQGAHAADVRAHDIARDAAIDGGIGHAVAAEPVGAMRAASVLAGDVEPFHRRAGVGVDHHAAHEVMRGRHHLDQAAGQIEARYRRSA